jgi:hypothetical protein
MPFDRERWSLDLLKRLGMPPTRENVIALVAWQQAEGGHTNNDARWNPLNTTQPWPGATRIPRNAPGVKAYRSYDDGLAATVKTLQNGRYPGILVALRKGNSADAVVNAVIHPVVWGTSALILKTLPGARRTVKYRQPVRPGKPPVKRPPSMKVVVVPEELRAFAQRIDDGHDLVAEIELRSRRLEHALLLETGRTPNRAHSVAISNAFAPITASTGMPLLMQTLTDDSAIIERHYRNALAADEGGQARPPAKPGVTPKPPATGRQAAINKMLQVARTQLGYHERDEFNSKFSDWFGVKGPWCAMFVSWVFWKAGKPLPKMQQGLNHSGFAGVNAGYQYFRDHRQLHPTPQVGDVVLFKGPTWEQDHTGIVTAVYRKNGMLMYDTIEGNTSDAVRTHSYVMGQRRLYGFGRAL